MNRRAAMLMTLLSGGWLSRSAWARAQPPNDDPPSTQETQPRSSVGSPYDADDINGEGGAPADNFPAQPGHQYRAFDITRYTKLRHSAPNPEKEIVKWLLRRTGESTWFGPRAASLSVDANEVRVYHNAKVVRQSGELIDRFVNATADVISMRVRYIAVSDLRWRYSVFSRMKLLTTGPQGQQAWLAKIDDSASAYATMQNLDSDFRQLEDKRYDIINGQALFVKRVLDRTYTVGMQREGPAGFGSQPSVKALEEGVTLSASPLLHFDDNSLELALDLKAVTVKSLLRTKVIAPRNVGPPEMRIDVPEVIESRLETTIEEWPLGQTLIVSMGILPNILRETTGIANAFRRFNGNTELLVFLDAEIPAAPRVSRRNRES